jgi:hypothetical protein
MISRVLIGIVFLRSMTGPVEAIKKPLSMQGFRGSQREIASIARSATPSALQGRGGTRTRK